ncbi:PIN-like domain-containing protein [Ruegeria atlantica]|uniref:PIN-like domain-containing protein n=1 Tax=Ruegeria atlantica TaxID=81569 RepID=UPI0014801990|nr:PIN domain-containing protein [Ruegeria atlantica]
MRSKFRGHFSESQESIDELWQTATFVFDANVLLNLYRYSDKTRTEFVRIIKGIQDRVWIPEQCAFEFFGNRLSVISEQERAYKSTGEELAKIEERFSRSNRHPFLSEASHNELSSVLKKISKELEKSRKRQETRFNNDDIKDMLADVFEGRVGDAFDSDTLKDIFLDGETRYAESIPPGYKDKDKVKNPETASDKRRVFGDLILWKQTIDHAKNAQTDVILVTDDSKDDWWQKQSGRTISPRPELIEEFCSETEKSVMIYSPDRFVQHAGIQLGSRVSEATVDEVKAEHTDQDRNKRASISSWRIPSAAAELLKQGDPTRNQLTKLRKLKEINSLYEKTLDLKNQIKSVDEKIEFVELLDIGSDDDKQKAAALMQEKNELKLSLAECEYKLSTLLSSPLD